MTKVLKADSSVADAWVEIDLGSSHLEVWVTFRLSFSVDAATFWEAYGSALLVTLLLADDTTFPDWMGAVGLGSSSEWQIEGGQAGNPVPVVQQKFELHHVRNGVSELYRDGVLLIAGTDTSSGGIRFVRVGEYQARQDPSQVVFFSSVKVGTTRGGSELFHDNFSSGNLDAWTTVVGDVAVVDDTPPFVLTPVESGSLDLTPVTPGTLTLTPVT